MKSTIHKSQWILWKWSVAVFSLILSSTGSFAQIGPSGATDVVINQSETYTYVNDYIVGSPTWDIVGGNITSTSQSWPNYYVTVLWTSVGAGSVTFLDGTYQLGTLQVNVSNPPTPPDPPIANQPITPSTTSFLASWNTVSGATSYRLDVSTVTNFASFVSGYNNLAVTATSQSVTGLSAGTTYYYRVRAVNANGSSGNSNTVTAITLPVAPTASSGTGGTASSFTANWGAVASATSYRLDVSTSSGFGSFVTGYNNLTVSGTSQPVTGLAVNTTYYYRVRAVNGGGTSANSTVITMATATSPPSVSGATSISTTSFVANWSTVAGAASYRLDVSTASDFSSFVSGFNNFSAIGTSQSITGLIAGTTYYYRVRTVNSYGSISNSSSNATTITLPNAPTLNAATTIGQTSFNVTWNAIPGATTYWVYVSTSTAFDTFVAGYNAYPHAATSISISGLTGNTTYYVKVRAVNLSGASADSNVISALTLPVAPIGLQGSSIQASSFTAGWASAGVSSYRLDVSGASDFSSFVSGYNNLLVNSTSQSVTGLSVNTTYYFRVRSVNATGVSSNSVTQTVITQPVTPTATAATGVQVFSFTANWNAAAGAVSYLLDVATDGSFVNLVAGYGGLSVTGTSQSVTGLNPSTTYYYRLRSINVVGTQSGYSNSISVATPSFVPVASAATSITTSSFLASWNPIPGATGYLLYVSTNASFSPCISGYNGTAETTTSRTVGGLQPNATYYYRVKATAGAQTSAESNTVSILTLPSAPTSLSASSITSSSFLASWAPDVSVTYRLDVSSDSQFGTLISGYNNLTISANSHTVTGLNLKTTYYFRVRAVNASGTSANSTALFAVNLDRNYLRSVDILKAGITNDAQVEAAAIQEKSVKYDFVDGLGRPLQSVALKQSPSQADIVQALAYDEFGRETVKYLPFASGNDGWYKFDFRPVGPFYSSSLNPHYQFYAGTNKVAADQKPYAVSILENSPLNRVIEQGSPGTDFQPDSNHGYTSTDHTVKNDYQTNSATEVLRWTYTAPNGSYPMGMVSAGSVAAPTYYAANQLAKTKTKDEDGNEVIEYTDKQGRVVLKRVQAVAGTPDVTDSNYASTYYVYDDLGQLVYVIPPEATKRLVADFHDASVANKETFMGLWAFRYLYDYRRRMSHKQVPGAGIVYMVYNLRDQVVMTQDGNQRPNRQWTYTKYDKLNRPIITGTYIHGTVIDQAAMSAQISTTQFFETYNGVASTEGYTNTLFPTTGTTLLTVTYYDDYSFRSLWSGTWTYLNESLSETANGINYTQPISEFTRVVGQVTGTKTRVLDGGTTNATWLKSINYYDDRYRVVQTLSDNYKGGTDRVTTVLDFTGKVLKTKATHNEQDITWKDLVGTVSMGDKLNRTLAGSSWAAGAVSTTQLPAGQNGWIELTLPDVSGQKMIALVDTNPDAGYTSLDYALYLNGSTLQIYENGALKTTVSGALVAGNVLRIERNGTTITYKRNGTTVYTSATASSTMLMADASIYTAAASLTGVRASFGSSTRTTVRRFEYDHAGRLLKVKHQLDAQPEIVLLANEYNELGQLVDKKLHSDDGTAFKQSVDHRYNIRGWLTSINNSKLEVNATTNDEANDLFGMELKYNAVDADIANTGLFNGNISGVKWSNYPGTGTTKEKGYTYSYDPLNRLNGSVFKERTTAWTTPANSVYAETGFTYDLNGNILTLSRNDGRTTGAAMDVLSYSYAGSGNKLLRVTDGGDDFKGFIDGTNTGDDYTYDANGNMTRDLNKGIGNSLTDATNLITYNYLNLPETITKGGNNVRYIYDATGRKLSQVTTFGGQTKQTDYAGEYVYENDALQFINHEEGRIVVGTNALVYTNAAESVTDFTAVNATLALVTMNGTEKYVRVTSNGTTARTGVFPVGGNIPVVAGEKYRIRVKGYYTGSSPVHIQAKASGADIIWPGAQLASNVASESWTEQIVIMPPAATTLQVGVNWNTVTAGQIFYLNEIEITRLTAGTPEYQYHLKDHLGNVRTTFTSVTAVDQNTATLEAASLNAEQSQFLRIATAKRVSAAIFDRTNGTSTGFSERLNGSANEKYGVAKSISVMPGDVIQAEVYGKYVDQNSSNWTGALTTLMNQIAANTAGVVYDGASYTSSTSSFPFAGLLSTAGSTGGPKAYLNWLIFDKNYTLITGGYQRMSAAPKEQGQDVAHELMSSPTITITQAGYVYIYLSNEETTPVEVYFDDFKVTHTKSPVVQSEDYYPFGLSISALSYQRENSTENRYVYNQGTGTKTFKTERVYDLGLNVDMSRDRTYDYITGRWWQVDPMGDKEGQESWSTYQYGFDNPVRYNDPNGDCIPCALEMVKVLGNLMKGTDAGTKQRYQAEPKRGSTVTGIRDTKAPGGRPQAVVRVDQPHGSTNTPHVNVNPKLTGVPDPHTPISTGTLKTLGAAGKTLEGISAVAKPVAVVTDVVRIGAAVQADGGTVGNETIKTTSSVAGGWAGAWAGASIGATGGAKVGGLIGTAIEPGGGTVVGGAIGGFVGGLGGGIAGAFGGSWLAEKTAETVIENK
ncbi:MAG: fibronectin type III domain-containing protein [Cyclobacteriaceae bacterium]|nr:fibronectin type III domain-containing protein [Cyclobacteriaceae bacterium]